MDTMLIEFGVPSRITKRIWKYDSLRMNINLRTGTCKSDVVIMDNENKHRKIGECEVYKNGRGVFIKSIQYFINLKDLREYLIPMSNSTYRERRSWWVPKMSCYGSERDGISEGLFAFVFHSIGNKDIDQVWRQLKLDKLT